MELNNFSFIFIGDTHGFINDFKKQKEIINQVNPEYVLFEKLEDFKLESQEDFNRILQLENISDMTKVNEIKKLIKFCQEKNIKMIGIDFKNFGLNKNLIDVILGKKDITKKEEKEFERILNLRETHQNLIIQKYRNKTSSSIVIILGSWHLRPETQVLNNLTSYVLIYPSVDGKLIFEPTDKEITYNIKWKE